MFSLLATPCSENSTLFFLLWGLSAGKTVIFTSCRSCRCWWASLPGLPARSLFREKVAIGTFLQNWVLKGSLLWVKSPYFTISYENNAFFLRKSFQFLLLLDLLLHVLKPEAQKRDWALNINKEFSKVYPLH